MRKYQIFRFYYQGDNNKEEGERLISLLKDGWKIISTGGVHGVIIYILEKDNL